MARSQHETSRDSAVRATSDGLLERPLDELTDDVVDSGLGLSPSQAESSLDEATVEQGVVYLRGQVPGPEDAENAEEVAGRVPGVAEVVEELEVAAL